MNFHLTSSAWSLWKARLQQHRDIHTLEDQALKHRALNLQRRVKICSDTNNHTYCNFCVLLGVCSCVSLLIQGLASVEGVAHNCLLRERERIQSVTSLHHQIEKKDTTTLDELCVLLPNKEKVTG